MPISERENYLRNASMTGPQWIPCHFYISEASWDQFRDELEDVLVHHPLLFPDFKRGQRNHEHFDFGLGLRANEVFTDAWGYTWKSALNGIEAVVVKNPLDDWSRLNSYKPPDPLRQGDRGPADWEGIEKRIQERKKRGQIVPEPYPHTFCLPHGFFFQRLYNLRGFENLMLDLVNEEPRLPTLIKMLIDHNMKIVNKWLSMDVDIMIFGEDLGSQTSSIISPGMFHGWITPAYKKLMQPCCNSGCHVYLHSDGYIMDLIDEFIEAGVTIINPQDICNGIRNLAREVKGRMCISLDIDRQKIVPYGTCSEIRDLIEREVKELGSPKGGLELVAGIYPPTPPENINALCCAMEEFMTYRWD